MLCKMIIEVPASLEFTPEWCAANPTILTAINALDAKWPEAYTSSTKILDGRKIIVTNLEIPGDEKLARVQGLIAAFGLDWQVLALADWNGDGVYLPVEARALQFLDDRPYTYDQDGVQVEGLLTPDVSWIPVISGQSPWV